MASVSFVRGKWRCLVRKRGAQRGSMSFTTREEAEEWGRAREAGGPAPVARPAGGQGADIAALLRAYRSARADSGRPIDRTANEHYMLRHLEIGLAGIAAGKLKPSDIVAYAQRRRRAGAGPYTVSMEVSKLGTALRHACALLDEPMPGAIASARPLLHHLGLIGAGNKRTRRPSDDEWPRLLARLAEQPTAIPMIDIALLAGTLGLRRGEICRIEWADVDPKRRTLVVRDRKDPRRKAGNDQTIPLVGDALAIIMRQPRGAWPRIFPYRAGTVTYWWTRTCRELGIADLHLHDLRHDSASRLIESGFSVPEAALVTGHKDWKHLQRYVQLKPERVAEKPVRSLPAMTRTSPRKRPRL